jgi:hypothetical protein
MEPENPLPQSQLPPTYLYPEPARFSPSEDPIITFNGELFYLTYLHHAAESFLRS